jgi:hypothetical protein
MGIDDQSRARDQRSGEPRSIPSDAVPAGRPDPALERPDAHPNAPRRATLALAFAGIALAGLLGGLIGFGLVETSCSDTPTLAQRLGEQVPRYEAQVGSCEVKALGGAALGTAVAGIGAGIIASLILRAQSEWRAHPPQRAAVSRARSGGTPPRT